jgi:hypothetical protein
VGLERELPPLPPSRSPPPSPLLAYNKRTPRRSRHPNPPPPPASSYQGSPRAPRRAPLPAPRAGAASGGRCAAPPTATTSAEHGRRAAGRPEPLRLRYAPSPSPPQHNSVRALARPVPRWWFGSWEPSIRFGWVARFCSVPVSPWARVYRSRALSPNWARNLLPCHLCCFSGCGAGVDGGASLDSKVLFC